MSINLQVVSATGWAVGRFEVTERNTRKQGIPETITGKAGLARNAPGTRFRSVQSPLDPVTHLNQRRGPSNRYDVLTCTVEVLGAKGSLGNRSWLEYEQFLSPEPGHLVLIITGLPTARMNIGYGPQCRSTGTTIEDPCCPAFTLATCGRPFAHSAQ